MCREAAWTELTVEVTSVVGVRSKARGLNIKSHKKDYGADFLKKEKLHLFLLCYETESAIL